MAWNQVQQGPGFQFQQVDQSNVDDQSNGKEKAILASLIAGQSPQAQTQAGISDLARLVALLWHKRMIAALNPDVGGRGLSAINAQGIDPSVDYGGAGR
jgi:hypothetical protein